MVTEDSWIPISIVSVHQPCRVRSLVRCLDRDAAFFAPSAVQKEQAATFTPTAGSWQRGTIGPLESLRTRGEQGQRNVSRGDRYSPRFRDPGEVWLENSIQQKPQLFLYFEVQLGSVLFSARLDVVTFSLSLFLCVKEPHGNAAQRRRKRSAWTEGGNRRIVPDAGGDAGGVASDAALVCALSNLFRR